MEAGEPNRVSAIEFNRLRGFLLRTDDLVITLKHATKIGRVWIVEDNTPRIFARNIGLIRLRTDAPILPSVLLLYLWTSRGQLLLDRCATGGTTGQITLPMSELKRLPIPPFSDQDQSDIDSLFRQSRVAKHASSKCYDDAAQRLDSALGLSDWSVGGEVGYSALFSDVERSRRIDAYHYHPQSAAILARVAAIPHETIRAIKTYNRRGVQPRYFPGGDVDVINSQHIMERHLNYAGFAKTSRAAYLRSPEAHVRTGDILIYSTGAYVGRANIYLDARHAMASNHVNILRVLPEIDAAYLSMLLQSVIGQSQTQMHVRGSTQVELYPTDIDRFVVPLLPHKTQIEIGNLVRDSLEKQREAARLLLEAKARVEQLVEKAVQG
jgi:hypothetical protein